MPLWWTLILVVAILYNGKVLFEEMRKPSSERNQAKVTKSAITCVVGFGLLVWSQTMLMMIASALTTPWFYFVIGGYLIVSGLVKLTRKHPAFKKLGKQNIAVGLAVIAIAYYYFYLQ